jgi:hypothetical protein
MAQFSRAGVAPPARDVRVIAPGLMGGRIDPVHRDDVVGEPLLIDIPRVVMRDRSGGQGENCRFDPWEKSRIA